MAVVLGETTTTEVEISEAPGLQRWLGWSCGSRLLNWIEPDPLLRAPKQTRNVSISRRVYTLPHLGSSFSRSTAATTTAGQLF